MPSAGALANRIRAAGDIYTGEAVMLLQLQIDDLSRGLRQQAATAAAAVTGKPTGVTISSITLDYIGPDDNGAMWVQATVTYIPPGVRAGFNGVNIHVEQPAQSDGTPLDPTGGPVLDTGFYGKTGTGGAETVKVKLRPPTRQEGWRFYVVSKSEDVSNSLKLGDRVDASPNMLVTVDPIPSGASGTEWTPNVTSFTASAEYGVDEVGGQMWRVRGTFTPPTDAKYRGVRIVGRYGTNDRQMSVEPRQATGYVSPWFPVPESPETWTIYAQSIGPNSRDESDCSGHHAKRQCHDSAASGTGRTEAEPRNELRHEHL